MGGCYSVIAVTRLKMLRRNRGAAAVLPITNGDDDTCCRSPDNNNNAIDDDNKGMGCCRAKRRCRKDKSKHASILGPDAAGEPDFARRYRLGAELGRGEFGVTRRCEDVATGEALACKTIRRRRLLLRRGGPDAVDVRREVEITRRMSELGGPVVRLREACEDADGVHLLCHENGVMHRDLKPENFLFLNKSEDSPLKAIDFGLSVYFKPGDRFTEVVGSGCYMAPEVLNRSYGPEIDVWSAGVILHILLCGFPPFWGDSDEKIAQAILRGGINLQRDPWHKVSQSAKDLIRKMLDPNPSNRLTAKQVLEEIDKYNEMFQKMDKDKDGNLTLEELKEGLQINGHPVPEAEIKMLLEAGDIEGTGMLDCEEFITILLHIKKMSNEEYLPKAFKFFDKDGNGFIDMEELMEALGDDELGPNEQVIHDIVRDVDKDKDGRISYPEFESMMKAGTDWRNASRRYSRANLTSLSRKLCKGTL
ncbi:hypothetical protein PR202_ga16315 [Eleusine coracana subsp. coracana]|uniref:Uncharacterized protein n=1 Tax=Eleusine coracana subsp. coracana TaxID=191504 RepID=A0AAV5CLB0_ELECO|nr:hypothetical protein PR202_ga16315 [Eleusine coracana subsp. coracana]